VLERDDTRAEIVEDYDRREIHIRVAGRHKRDLLTVILHELDRIHGSFRQLQYEKLIPCRCLAHHDDPEYFKFKVLQNALAKGITEIQCQKCFEMIEVQPLVDDVLPREKSMPERGGIPEYMRERIEPPEPTTEPAPSKPEVFISYAWGGESERIVDELEQALRARRLTIVRDKRDLDYKGRIREFMQRIGKGRYVIVVISDKYLKSENCMFELLEIAKHGDFYRRIFPVVLNDANIYRAINLLRYIKHWEKEIENLDQAMKEVNAANLQGVRDSIDLYTKIREMIARLTVTLKDMNTLTPEMHESSGFEALYRELEKSLRNDGYPIGD